MVNSARVRLWGRTVGVVVWHQEFGYSEFEFDKSFLNSGIDVAPIKMPIEEAQKGLGIFAFPNLNTETFRGLPGMLADSLPDRFGDRIMEAWLQKQGRDLNDMNPVERLCYTGKRGMGALEFEPVQQMFEQKSAPLEIDELVELARSVMNERATLKTNMKDDDALMDILRVGTSAGGARAKAIIAFNEITGEVRSGQVDGSEARLPVRQGFSYWLIKFDGVQSAKLGDPMGYGRIEYAYYKMVLAAGIEMAPCRLLEEGERAHFMTKRFDRQLDPEMGKVEKLHMQTLCGMAHFDYNDPSAYSYEQAFKVMRQLALPYPDAEQLFRRMCFNVMARNQDDHTKNISFLMDKNGIWSLAPAYDMTYAFDPKSKWLKVHQMSVNGKREGIEKEDLFAVAKSMNIKKAQKLIEQVASAIKDWKRFAEDAGVAPTQIAAIARVLRSDMV